MRWEGVWAEDDAEVWEAGYHGCFVRLGAAGCLPVFVEGGLSSVDCDRGEEFLDFEACTEDDGVYRDVPLRGSKAVFKELHDRFRCELDVVFV